MSQKELYITTTHKLIGSGKLVTSSLGLHLLLFVSGFSACTFLVVATKCSNLSLSVEMDFYVSRKLDQSFWLQVILYSDHILVVASIYGERYLSEQPPHLPFICRVWSAVKNQNLSASLRGLLPGVSSGLNRAIPDSGQKLTSL